MSLKRYRYTGKERDEETGLYYHGARYYAPWVGGWVSYDPAGITDSTNLYWYARAAPASYVDYDGADPVLPNDTRTNEERNASYQLDPTMVAQIEKRLDQQVKARDPERVTAGQFLSRPSDLYPVRGSNATSRRQKTRRKSDWSA